MQVLSTTLGSLSMLLSLIDLEVMADKSVIESAFWSQAVWIQILVPPVSIYKFVGQSFGPSLNFLSYKKG